MASFKSWISALRPRTLFLATATTLTGSAISLSEGKFCWIVFILATSLALMLQLLANLANDLGDFEHGTDITGQRIGPERAVQSRAISIAEMKRAIFITSLLSAIIGLSLVVATFLFISWIYIAIFIAIGAGAIIAARRYTSGKNPYGYRGLGDIYSFVFFGPVAVIGTYFLHTQKISFLPVLPAISMGLLTVCVLNLNNMRDIDNDKASNKITIPVKLGIDNAKKYHAFLTFGALICFVSYSILYSNDWYQYLYLLAFVLLIGFLLDIFRIKENKKLDKYLMLTSLSTFLLAICFFICINI